MPSLHVQTCGTGAATVVLVHGFTQSATSWRPVAEELAHDHRVVCVDAPGHGGSAAVRADLAHGARLLADVAPGAVHVGYSMGARSVLRMALDHPGSTRGIVLVGGTAGIDDADERARRRAADEELARRLERDGTVAFIDRWVRQDLFGPRPLAEDDLASRRAQDPAALASSLRLAGTGTMEPPWWDELGSAAVPALVLWGEHDRKFAALGARLAAGLGATGLAVPDAHHAAHLDQPALVAAHIRRFVLDVAARPDDQGR